MRGPNHEVAVPEQHLAPPEDDLHELDELRRAALAEAGHTVPITGNARRA
ncbi:hypothetical protein [Hoyosella subflava]|uniref:Uncharacterized protein n=1 Tax=Hoyosella subflava (strain DSM 45089 / JCM 17490 / NBRC 109087 / DQS3-9A1) TaxID=443218 RepID=F6EQZ1_HOYSD|nr:hypothetical protein [Hoyosella subflava]AEF40678.1 hypothetical protein AS9A_2229 [Hoyosella subflava DQS3-9A1]